MNNNYDLMRSNYQDIILELQSEVDTGGHGAKDIARNLLREVNKC